jgi:hypothetical protein
MTTLSTSSSSIARRVVFALAVCAGVLLARGCNDGGGIGRHVFAQAVSPKAYSDADQLQRQYDALMREYWRSDSATRDSAAVDLAQLADQIFQLNVALIQANTERWQALAPVLAATRPRDPGLARYGLKAGMALPDTEVTPGAINAQVVGDRSHRSRVIDGIETNICAPHFSAKAIRKTIRNFPKLKREACAQYGVKKCDGHIEGDHLISIEIGGCPDCLTNLWPQPMDEARIKDHQVEDVLPKLVCAGKISLADAQSCIANDWVACGERVKKLEQK